MSLPNDGGPAFPTENERQVGHNAWHYQGMTLRDYFAAAAMQGFIASNRSVDSPNGDVLQARAMWCYYHADAMLKARNKEGGAK